MVPDSHIKPYFGPFQPKKRIKFEGGKIPLPHSFVTYFINVFTGSIYIYKIEKKIFFFFFFFFWGGGGGGQNTPPPNPFVTFFINVLMCLEGLIYKTKKKKKIFFFSFLVGGGEGEGRGYTYPMYCTHTFLHLYPPFGGQHVNQWEIWAKTWFFNPILTLFFPFLTPHLALNSVITYQIYV